MELQHEPVRSSHMIEDTGSFFLFILLKGQTNTAGTGRRMTPLAVLL